MWHASQMEVRRPHSQRAAVVAPDDDEQMLMLHQYEELSTPLGAGLPPPQPGRRRSRWKEITMHCKMERSLLLPSRRNEGTEGWDGEGTGKGGEIVVMAAGFQGRLF